MSHPLAALHEMNGDWFWWAGLRRAIHHAALYRQIFDRLVNHHQLKNLIWLWSMDRVDNKPKQEQREIFPRHRVCGSARPRRLWERLRAIVL